MDLTMLAPGVAAAAWSGLMLLVTWSLVWKGIALWKCGRKNQLAWFIVLLILNTAGILPIIYLLFFQRKTVAERRVVKQAAAKQVKKKR